MTRPMPFAAPDLLNHFEDEERMQLEILLVEGKITPVHIQQLVKLTSVVPGYRDSDEFISLLEDASEMDAVAFAAMVEKCIETE